MSESTNGECKRVEVKSTLVVASPPAQSVDRQAERVVGAAPNFGSQIDKSGALSTSGWMLTIVELAVRQSSKVAELLGYRPIT